MNNSVLPEALRLTSSGLSVVPIKTDGTKAPPPIPWKPFQTKIPGPPVLKEWFENCDRGLAIVGGEVSGNLEILDFDDPETAKAFGELFRKQVRNHRTMATSKDACQIVQTRFVYQTKGNDRVALRKNCLADKCRPL